MQESPPSPHFQPHSLLRPGYLLARLRSLRSADDILRRIRAAAALLVKLATGRYGEEYWERQRRAFLDGYERGGRSKEDSLIHLQAAALYELRGRREEALAALEAAAAADPADRRTRLRLGTALLEAGRFTDAEEVLDSLESEGADGPEFRRQRARLFEETRRPGEAVRELDRGLKTAPEDAGLRSQKSRVLAGLGNFTSALAESEAACAAAPDSAPALLQSAELLWRARRYEEAGPVLRRLRAAGPPGTEAAVIEARILNETRSPRAALRLLEPHLSEGSVDPRVYFEAARAHQALGSSVQAERRCRRGVELDGRHLGLSREPAFREFLINKVLSEAELFRGEECLTRPTRLSVLLTSDCNLDCLMCSQREKPPDSLGEPELEKVRGLLPYTEYVTWQGGEAFLSDHLRDLLIWVHERFPWVRQGITTNGTLIDEAWAETLAEVGAELTFSIDSVVQETYEAIRAGADYHGLRRSLAWVRDAYRGKGRIPHFAMNHILMKRNLGELTAVPEFCETFGFSDIFLQKLDPVRVPEEEVLSDAAAERRLHASLPGMAAHCRELGLYLHTCFPGPGGPKPAAHPAGPAPARDQGPWAELIRTAGTPDGVPLRPDSSRDPRCDEPWKGIHIEFNGEVFPNCACRHPLGSLRTGDPMDLWNGPQMRAYRRGILDGKGSRCHSACVTTLKQEALDSPFFRPKS